MDYVRYCLASNLRLRRSILQSVSGRASPIWQISRQVLSPIWRRGEIFPYEQAILKISSALKIEPWKLFLDPQKQDMFFTRDEVFQWWKDSRERLLGLSPKQAEEKSDSSLARTKPRLKIDKLCSAF